MICRLEKLRDKEVINIKDGGRVGFVCDVELDVDHARLTALVVYGRLRLLGLLGRLPDLVIPWEDVVLMGEDAVLVRLERPLPPRPAGLLGRVVEKFAPRGLLFAAKTRVSPKVSLDSPRALCYNISAKHTPRFGLVPGTPGLARENSTAEARPGL